MTTAYRPVRRRVRRWYQRHRETCPLLGLLTLAAAVLVFTAWYVAQHPNEQATALAIVALTAGAHTLDRGR